MAVLLIVAAFSRPLAFTIEIRSKILPSSMTMRPSTYISPNLRPGSCRIAFSASSSIVRTVTGTPDPSPRMARSPDERMSVRLPF
ncbi:hypothetical protein D9M72_612290 [compost metagenome]